MSLFHIYRSTDDTLIPLGKSVVLDAGKVRAFDSQTDAKTDIIGITAPKTRLSGRQIVDGEILYATEPFVYTEFLQYALDENNNYINNQNYDANFDYTVDDKYQNICVHGQASGLNTEAVHPNWSVINDSYGQNTKLYLIR